jgi:hypothetical protein
MHRNFIPSRIPLHDEEELFRFACEFSSLAGLWDACPRSDWMLWLVEQAAAFTLIEKPVAEAILTRFVLDAQWREQQAQQIRQALPNPFESIDETPLVARRRAVDYWLMDGDGPVVPKLLGRFKPTLH